MRSLCKRALFVIGFVASSPLIFITWLEARLFGEEQERIFFTCAEVLSLIPTLFGTYMRKAFYWATCKSVSWDTHFRLGSWLAHRNNIIGPMVGIGAYTYIGYADIGRNVIFGARVSIVSGKYQHGRPSERTQNEEISEKHEVIRIGDNSWIGQDVVIMANIGNNCTVGAGSVVMKDTQDNTTVLGNPARKVNLT
jgi:hypothetical protein